MTRHLLIEGEVPPDHPVFTEGGAIFMPTVGCFDKPQMPVSDHTAVNLSWFGNRICRSEWFNRDKETGEYIPDGVPLVTPGEWVNGMRNGLLDYDAEAANVAGLAGLHPKYVLIPNEAGLDPWSSSARIWDCIKAICTDAKCKLKAPVALRDLWDTNVFDKFAQGWQADPLYDQHQALWKAWIATRKADGYRKCLLSRDVITPETVIITNFIAAIKRPVLMPDNKWSIGKSVLPPQVCSNWQLYGHGWDDTQRCIDLSDSTRWFPTLHALSDPMDLAQRLLNAPNGAVLYMGDGATPDNLTPLIPLIRAYTGGK